MEHQANTIWLKAYTPGGFQVGITIGFQDGKLPLAVDVEAMVTGAGYALDAPGIEPGEVTEPILYVCRYDHTDTKTGEQIPHIAFYSESDWLTKRWLHVYLDKPEDVEAFETATGLTVATMPVWLGETHPERNNPKAQKFIMRLAKPIRIARDTYTNKDGETRHKLKRYVDTIGTPQTSKPQPAATGSSGQPTGDTGKPANIDAPDFTPDEKSWKQRVMDLTAFLYNDEHMQYNGFEHTASIQKRMNDTTTMGINPTMSVMSAVTIVLAYRATKDLSITVTEFPQALGGKSLALFMKDFPDIAEGLQKAWARLVDHAMKRPQPKAS